MKLNELGPGVLYNDCPDEVVAKIEPQLEGHSQDAFETPIDFIAADVTIPKGYVICKQDLAIPTALQEMLVQAIPGMKVARIDASHSPFLSKPKKAADVLVGMMTELIEAS
jgi:hypothetical protein